MKLRYWITVLVLGVLLVITLPISLSSYGKRDTIRRATSSDFIATISATLSPTNTHFAAAALVVKDIQYITDSVAVVKVFNTTDNIGAFLIFELHDNTLHITNYSGVSFSSSDFAADSAVVTQLINASSGM